VLAETPSLRKLEPLCCCKGPTFVSRRGCATNTLWLSPKRCQPLFLERGETNGLPVCKKFVCGLVGFFPPVCVELFTSPGCARCGKFGKPQALWKKTPSRAPGCVGKPLCCLRVRKDQKLLFPKERSCFVPRGRNAGFWRSIGGAPQLVPQKKILGVCALRNGASFRGGGVINPVVSLSVIPVVVVKGGCSQYVPISRV